MQRKRAEITKTTIDKSRNSRWAMDKSSLGPIRISRNTLPINGGLLLQISRSLLSQERNQSQECHQRTQNRLRTSRDLPDPSNR